MPLLICPSAALTLIESTALSKNPSQSCQNKTKKFLCPKMILRLHPHSRNLANGVTGAIISPTARE